MRKLLLVKSGEVQRLGKRGPVRRAEIATEINAVTRRFPSVRQLTLQLSERFSYGKEQPHPTANEAQVVIDGHTFLFARA